jgi:rhamnose utilization protein RhaD (predicted bifunctional aldolase and dehydrogenase)
MLILPGTGILLHRSTTRAADAMALCLADVVARIPGDAELLRLSPAQEFELTNWEAEKYRQGLAARTSS